MTLVRVLVLGLAVALVSAASAQDKAKLDPAKLTGTYTIVEAVNDGKKLPADQLKGLSVTITKDELVLKTPDGDFQMKHSVDATKTPATIDLEILKGPVGEGSKAKGIIALDGTTLKLAYHPMDGERPKDFDAKKGTGQHSFTLKKAEKKDK